MPNPIPVGPENLVAGWPSAAALFAPIVSELSDGRFAGVWFQSSDASPQEVWTCILNPDGTFATTPLLVEPIGTEGITLATVTALENGRFVVSWRDETFVGPDRASLAFKHQVFALDGTPVGTKTVVTSSPTHHLGSENTTMLPDGRFMTIWSDDGSADQGHIGSLNGQIFTAAGVADSAVLTFATSPRGFGRRHSVAMLPDGGLALSWEATPQDFQFRSSILTGHCRA